MPRVPTKKLKAKPAAEISAAGNLPQAIVPPLPESGDAPEISIETNAVEQSGSAGLRPPSTPVEPTNDGDTKFEERRFEERRGHQRDKIAASMNIAKLQAMSMVDLN